ncbi:MAG TPA: hypothetical protein VG106_06520, partial [Vicinamibacterales bacterium]|nr:hypothetical protein [Vicinamibacterales bacterium]
MEIANVELPPPGIGVQIHADFPADAPLTVDGIGYHSVTLDITPSRGVITRNAVATDGDGGGGGGGEATEECGDQAYKETGVSWAGG